MLIPALKLVLLERIVELGFAADRESEAIVWRRSLCAAV